MKSQLVILLLSFCFFSCEKIKMYEFIVENQLSEGTVEIVPKSKTDFWITSNESYTYIILPGRKIVIGAQIDHSVGKQAPDIYKPDDVIEPKVWQKVRGSIFFGLFCTGLVVFYRWVD